jgi:hypothetical protein
MSDYISPTGPIIGTKIIYCNEYANGVIVPVKIISKKDDKPKNLEAIWLQNERLTYQDFLQILTTKGFADGSTFPFTWLDGSASVLACYKVLSDLKCVTRGLDPTSIYRVFSGTFRLAKIKDARNLRSPGKSKYAPCHRQAEKVWREKFEKYF